MSILYTDLNEQVKSLSQEELTWFYSVCNQCKKAIGLNLEIEPDCHENLKGKSREALGILWTENPDNPLSSDSRITIDTYFIHECFEERFCGKWNLSFDTLEHVIAHEFAHLYQWRHCKRHRRITEELYQKIVDYAA